MDDRVTFAHILQDNRLRQYFAKIFFPEQTHFISMRRDLNMKLVYKL